MVREEYESEIHPVIFGAMWPLVADRWIDKVRHYVTFAGRILMLDIYHGNLTGLAIAEIEFANAEDATAFRAPPWFGREVTDDEHYSNHALALYQRIQGE